MATVGELGDEAIRSNKLLVVSPKLYQKLLDAMEKGHVPPKYGFSCVAEIQVWLYEIGER